MNNAERNHWANNIEWVIDHLNSARKVNDWRMIDEMLDILNELGVELEDEPDGSVRRKIQSAGDVKVGDWVVNNEGISCNLIIGRSYEVKLIDPFGVYVAGHLGCLYYIARGYYKLVTQKYRNPPRAEYRELCEAWLAGADINYISDEGNEFNHILFDNPTHCYMIAPESVLPQPDERKELIKKKLLNIDTDKLAQLIIDSGIEL